VIDPELAAVLARLPVLDMADPVALRALERERARSVSPERPGGLAVRDHVVPGLGADPAVTVRVYAPEGAPVPVLMWLHGGAFVFGDVAATDGWCVRTALAVGCAVVAVEYRLAPENPFPAALRDCLAALRWVAGHADRLEVDAGRIAVGGISAGGGLAAAVALAARDEGGPAPMYQVLDNASLDDRCDTPSMRAAGHAPVWTRGQARHGWRLYLGDTAATPYAAPARADDLAGLPAAYILANEYCPFRDEDIAYAVRLIRAGVPVELHVRPGTFHGSNAFPGPAVSRRATEDLYAALRSAFG
jgi:acetyl esterase/lipase